MCSKYIMQILFATILLLLATSVAFWIGHYPITPVELLESLKYLLGFGVESANLPHIEEVSVIFLEIRLPRILAAILIGASLSVSGAVFQGMFVNPLVSPGILGVLAGASFGAALGMVLRLPYIGIQASAFVFAFLAVLTAIGIAKMYGRGNNILMLILGGVVSISLFNSLVSMLKYISDPYDTLPTLVYWLMGSLSIVSLNNVLFAAVFMLVSIVLLALFGKHLNLLSLGEDDAKALGVDVKKIRLLVIVLATLLSALSVMLCGVVGWIGLVIPHIARFLVGPNHTILIPFSAIIGAIFLLLVDSVSRAAFIVEVPLSILTSVIGIPVFVLVLRYTSRSR